MRLSPSHLPPSLPPARPPWRCSGYDDSAAALALVSSERSKGLAADESTLDKHAEVALGEGGGEVVGKTYWWQDKYRPRKPRYFNRVKTGKDIEREGGGERRERGAVDGTSRFAFSSN